TGEVNCCDDLSPEVDQAHNDRGCQRYSGHGLRTQNFLHFLDFNAIEEAVDEECAELSLVNHNCDSSPSGDRSPSRSESASSATACKSSSSVTLPRITNEPSVHLQRD